MIVDEEMYKVAVRKLLGSTFIMRRKDKKVYDYIMDNEHREFIMSRLEEIGYGLEWNEEDEIVSLTDLSLQNGEETPYNFHRFSPHTIYMLFVLMLIYEEKKANWVERIIVNFEEVQDRLQSLHLDITPSEKRNAYKQFRRYNLISVKDRDLRLNVEEGGTLEIYPSIMFCMKEEQFALVLKDLEEKIKEREEGEDNDYNDENMAD
jgi:hypothetical protein